MHCLKNKDGLEMLWAPLVPRRIVMETFMGGVFFWEFMHGVSDSSRNLYRAIDKCNSIRDIV